MTDLEINEGNRIIAEFMNKKLHDDWMKQDGKLPQLYYHISWDALIPVYNRIMKVYSESDILKERTKTRSAFIYKQIIDHPLHIFENQVRITGTWIKIVDFIKWYSYQIN